MAAAQPRCLFRKHTRTALAEPDAWVGLTDVLEKVCQVQALDRGAACEIGADGHVVIAYGADTCWAAGTATVWPVVRAARRAGEVR